MRVGLKPLDVDAMEPWQVAAALGLAQPPDLEVAAAPIGSTPARGRRRTAAGPDGAGGLVVPGVGIAPGGWSSEHSIEEGRARRRVELRARIAAQTAARAAAAARTAETAGDAPPAS